jgi:uncharacterized membrane protein
MQPGQPIISANQSIAPPARGLVQLFASVVLLSSAWPLTKLALSLGATPLWFAEGRAVLSCLTGAILLLARGRIRLPGRADLPTLAAVGSLQLAAYFAFAHEALTWVPAGRTAILANTTTIWVVPLSLIFLKEHIPLRRWLAAGVGLAGVAVLMNPWAIDWTSAHVLIGNGFLLLSGLAWSVAIRRHPRFPPGAADVRADAVVLRPRLHSAAAAGVVARTARHARRHAGLLAVAGLYRLPRRPDRHVVRGGGNRQAAGHGLLGRLPQHPGGQPDPGQYIPGRADHRRPAGRVGADHVRRRGCRLAREKAMNRRWS